MLRSAARIALPFGALAAMALTLYAGRHNRSHLLVLVFVLWVLSPFAGLFWANRRGRPLDGATLVVTIASLAIYGAVAFGVVNAKIGFIFLVVPAACWLVIAVALSAGRRS